MKNLRKRDERNCVRLVRLCIVCISFLACPNKNKKLAEQTVAQAEMQVDEVRRLAGPNYFSEAFTKMEEFLAGAQKALDARNYSEAINLGNQAVDYANAVIREVSELKRASEKTGEPQEVIAAKRKTTKPRHLK